MQLHKHNAPPISYSIDRALSKRARRPRNARAPLNFELIISDRQFPKSQQRKQQLTRGDLVRVKLITS
jgi:hypothetical protein